MKLWSALMREESPPPLSSTPGAPPVPNRGSILSTWSGSSVARPRSVRSQPPKWQLILRSQHGRSREAEVLQLLASGRLPQPRLSFRSRVSRGASSDPLHARGVFSPHPSLSTTSRCACRMSCTGDAQSIRGASSGPLHARGVFPLTLVYHQDVHAASGMRAAPVMRSQSEGQKLWSASRARSLFPLIHSLPNRDVQAAPKMSSQSISTIQDVYAASSYILNVCSIRVHKPGCVRRMRATYWSCMRCMHSRGKLWSASAKPAALRDEPFPSALVCHPRCVCRIKASCTSDAQSFILHHPGCVCRIGYASYILSCVFDTSPPTRMCTPHRSELHTGRVCVSRI